MKGVLSRVEVVNDDLYDLALLEDEGLRVCPIHGRIIGQVTSRQGGIEGGYDGLLVRDVIKESVIGTITEVLHLEIELDHIIRFREDGLLVERHESDIVKWVERVHSAGIRIWLRRIVLEPPGDIPVQACRDFVKEVLDRVY